MAVPFATEKVSIYMKSYMVSKNVSNLKLDDWESDGKLWFYWVDAIEEKRYNSVTVKSWVTIPGNNFSQTSGAIYQ